jgi:murein DD-endopeptidase MepM/ murein hydrolase activator NlpD
MEAEWARVVSAQSAARKSLAPACGARVRLPPGSLPSVKGRKVSFPVLGKDTLRPLRFLTPQLSYATGFSGLLPHRRASRPAVPTFALLLPYRSPGFNAEVMHSYTASRLLALALSVASVLVLTGAIQASPLSASAATPAARWEWPLGSAQAVSRGFIAPPTRYAAGHRGIDLHAAPPDQVRAPAAGVVSFAGSVAGRPVLSIAHPGDLISSFEPVLSDVAEGDTVAAGAVVGSVASGGHCDAHCLHFGVRLHGEYVSPLLYLAGVPRAVLLPLDRPRR